MNLELGEFSRAIDLAGVFVNAVLGGVVAREFRMDPVGFVALAILSGLGGGLIRDTLLQHGPPVALTDSLYVVVAVAAAAVGFLIPLRARLWSLTYPIVDALALGTWAVVGAEKTLASGLSWLPAILLGTISAVGGGALRDLAVNRTPAIFGGNTLYATPAVAASSTVVLLSRYDLAPQGELAGIAVGACLCLLARWRGWRLGESLTADYYLVRRKRAWRIRIGTRVRRREEP
ncbi:trimeric intracellular cation channel family protein [Mycobacterium montefiorense]|uniref:trimeric intracellular cation channel family protein n=1 Tax=Mycobacterium montefiorense TaxID=154654 RepID=UPI0021DD08B7|nr:TRIC cation channel family protein [Mycobacterium montefiorense]MCV7429436.1 TRIC cation channel family protein [Mycobacterium montefiorense]GLE54167.1 membrane protein [Mycobacterium montefiorense]